ncbi:MAG: hypothetical protein ACKO6F_07620 [Cyanobium sp.]
MQGRERLLLCCGLGLSTSLVVAALGLRWPVLLPALLPPLAILGVWQWAQRRLSQPASSPPTAGLLDASGLRERLRLDAELSRELSPHWGQIAQRLEAVRCLAAACAELDPGCSVALLVLLERLVQRALAMAEHLCRLSRTASPGSLLLIDRRMNALQDHLQQCQEALTRCYEAALEQALRCPDLPAPVVLSTLLLES